MPSLIDIQSQIDKLQKQAEEIRSREYEITVKDIRSKMQAFGITLNDLRSHKSKTSAVGRPKMFRPADRVGKSPKKQSTKKVEPKFRGPDGETWSGRGLMPRWLSALVAKGHAKDEFAI